MRKLKLRGAKLTGQGHTAMQGQSWCRALLQIMGVRCSSRPPQACVRGKPCFYQPWVHLPGHSAVTCLVRRCSDTQTPTPAPKLGLGLRAVWPHGCGQFWLSPGSRSAACGNTWISHSLRSQSTGECPHWTSDMQGARAGSPPLAGGMSLKSGCELAWLVGNSPQSPNTCLESWVPYALTSGKWFNLFGLHLSSVSSLSAFPGKCGGQ